MHRKLVQLTDYIYINGLRFNPTSKSEVYHINKYYFSNL